MFKTHLNKMVPKNFGAKKQKHNIMPKKKEKNKENHIGPPTAINTSTIKKVLNLKSHAETNKNTVLLPIAIQFTNSNSHAEDIINKPFELNQTASKLAVSKTEIKSTAKRVLIYPKAAQTLK